MLTTPSGINNLTGYQVQLDVSNTFRPSNTEGSSSVNRSESTDTVKISSQARALQNEYQKKNSELEQRYNNEAQQLEREYRLEKNRLKQEFSQKKSSLDINVYA